MKTLFALLDEKYGPTSMGQKRFIDLHTMRVQKDENGNDSVMFNAANISKSPPRRADKNVVDTTGQDEPEYSDGYDANLKTNLNLPQRHIAEDATCAKCGIPLDDDNVGGRYPDMQVCTGCGGINETITKKTSIARTIDDFVHSKNKKFKHDSKKQRIHRALGAYYGMHKEDADGINTSVNTPKDLAAPKTNSFQKSKTPLNLSPGLKPSRGPKMPQLNTGTTRMAEEVNRKDIISNLLSTLAKDSLESRRTQPDSETQNDIESVDESVELEFLDGTTTNITPQLASVVHSIYEQLDEENQSKFDALMFGSEESFNRAMEYVEEAIDAQPALIEEFVKDLNILDEDGEEDEDELLEGAERKVGYPIKSKKIRTRTRHRPSKSYNNAKK